MSEKRAPLTEEEIDRAAEMRERRLTHGQIAHRLCCSVGSVSWALLKRGVDAHPNRPLAPVPTEPVVQVRGTHVVRRYTQDDDATLLALEASGLRVNQIASRMGRRHNSIVGRLRSLARRDARAEAQAS